MAQVPEGDRTVIVFPDADAEDCEANISFSNPYGDEGTTFYCQLRKGHEGPHREEGDMGPEEGEIGYGEEGQAIPYTLTWTGCSEVIGDD